ncbi:YozE family protein [Facklamia sp. P12937]|uniref:YozE family protein n=1 Tax=Facklamia sp. P12937 TaxID=3421949 RepID=UPI003D1808E4
MVPDFKNWVVKFKHEIGPKGDFAKDVSKDPNFPSGVSKSEIENYLLDHGACLEVMDIFLGCWAEYKEFYGMWFI